jgi:hypothetical protein
MEDIQIKIDQLKKELSKLNYRNYGENIRLKEKLLNYYLILGNKELEFDVRAQLVYNAAQYDLEKMLLHFSHMLQYHDSNQDKLSSDQKSILIQKYLRVLTSVYGSYKISKEQITSLWEDLYHRAKESSSIFNSLEGWDKKKPSSYEEKMAIIYYHGWRAYVKLGDTQLADDFQNKWYPYFDRTSMGQFSECPSCVLNREVSEAMAQNDFDLTIKKGKYLVNLKDTFFCGFVPSDTHSHIAEAYFSKGLHKSAETYIKKAKSANSSFPKSIYILWHLKHNEMPEALEALEKYIADQWNNIEYRRMECYHCTYLFLKKYEEIKGDDEVFISLPTDFLFYNSTHKYQVITLKEKLYNEYVNLSFAFDKRNKNNMVSKFYERREKLLDS